MERQIERLRNIGVIAHIEHDRVAGWVGQGLRQIGLADFHGDGRTDIVTAGAGITIGVALYVQAPPS